jgi:hypothetical protein
MGTKEDREQAFEDYFTGDDKLIIDRMRDIFGKGGMRLSDANIEDLEKGLKVPETRDIICRKVVAGDIEAGLLR